MKFRHALWLGLFIELSSCGLASAQGPSTSQDGVEARLDVVGAFMKLPKQGHAVKFERGLLATPEGGHIQGVQARREQDREIVFLSHDSKTEAYFLVVEFPRRFAGNGRVLHLQRLPGDGEEPPLRHAGGIQLCGDVLVLGVEDNQARRRSEVQFWDVRTPDRPTQLTHLTIRRRGAEADQTAGAVGLVKRKGDHVLAAANWDSRAIDFYVSNGKPLHDPQCQFSLAARWDGGKADRSAWRPDRRQGSYQAINLIADADGELGLLGFYTASSPPKDGVDLFRVALDKDSVQLTKRANKSMELTNGNHFQNGGGASFLDDAPVVFSTASRLGSDCYINIIRASE